MDHLTIETPEQIPLEFLLAGIGSRFLALAVDTLIQAAATVLLVVVALVIGVSAAISHGSLGAARPGCWRCSSCFSSSSSSDTSPSSRRSGTARRRANDTCT